MSIVISVVILIISVLLMLIVLVQNSKGGGLASNFSSQNQILGVRKTTDFLEKTTWTLAVLLVVFCLASSVMSKNGNNGDIDNPVKIENEVGDTTDDTQNIIDLQQDAQADAEAEK